MFGVLFAEKGLVGWDLPIDAEGGVEDADASICLWGIEVVALVLEDGGLAEDSKAMGEASGNEELTVDSSSYFIAR